jgi:protein-S-isoprenylcysteine O-methyltransferase Ste14
MLDIPTIERWIKLIATAFGILAICLPVFQVWQNRHTKIKHNLSKRASQNSWVLVFISTIAYISIGILLWKPIPIDISPSLLLFLDIAGMVLYFPGIFLYLWGLKTLGSTFGVSSSKGAQLYEQHHVIDSGPYAFLRHPMYFGVVLAAIGALLLFRTWAMVLFTPSSFVVFTRARREEQLLATELPAEWTEYCQRVPAWIPKFVRKESKAATQTHD